jgi:Sulfotransferase domain
MNLAPMARRLRPDLVYKYVSSLGPSLRVKPLFGHIESFCFFLGYPRSGHSLVGHLLDAHPDVVIAHELDVAGLLRWNFRDAQILSLILRRTRESAAGGSRSGGGYSYPVPGQWQGRFRCLRVIGDKKGAGTVRHLREQPELLDRLRALSGGNLRAVHVVRNPYDNIASMVLRGESVELDKAVKAYFSLAEGCRRLLGNLSPEEQVTVYHEDFRRDPRSHLKDLCHFVGVEAPDDYLDACARVVEPAPHRTSGSIAWPPEVFDEVHRRAAAVPHLRRYVEQDLGIGPP